MPDSARSSLDQNGIVVKELSRYLGRGTNNVAEYPGLLIGLEVLPQLKKTLSCRAIHSSWCGS